MRIWSLHPKYLDSKRLVAQWREALLCKAVIEGKTKGYTKHPQFLRIKEQHPDPLSFINMYLKEIKEEGDRRGYKFDGSKIDEVITNIDKIYVTTGQLEYEFEHIQKKIGEFNEKYIENENSFLEEGIEPNNMFLVTFGDIMEYEKIK